MSVSIDVESILRKCDPKLDILSRDILRDAKSVCPVRTGALRDSGVVETPEPHTREISFDAGHALFVEYGTERMAAQPFLRPAALKDRRV